MPKEITFVFPNQLYKINPAMDKNRLVFLIEECLFFKQCAFHKQKLILHRASMQFYKKYLEQQHFEVRYIEATNELSDTRNLIAHLSEALITDIYLIDPIDNWLLKRIKNACKHYAFKLNVLDNPNYINTLQDVDAFFKGRKTYFQTDFYNWQRKKHGILIASDGKPLGGKWSFDTENRNRIPKNEILPKLWLPKDNEFIFEAKQYVHEYFSDNVGEIEGPHLFPINFEDAEIWLKNFLETRFSKFGIYEDALVAKEKILYHSVLAPIINIGLLQPKEVISKAIEFANKKNIPLNSLEGFVRQILGWREFIRIVYEREGSRQRTTNFWKFKRKIPKSFRTGETGILPIDITIQKILKMGYCHHIERLMLLGNFMLLCEFDPNEVYLWFMEMFIDAYDWVMVPNIYGMTQFADGGLMTTKPYISGSNYLMKMGDFEKGDWQQVWDGLFWRFLHVHRSFFLKNPRIGMLVHTYDKMPVEKKQMHLNHAQLFLNTIDNDQL